MGTVIHDNVKITAVYTDSDDLSIYFMSKINLVLLVSETSVDYTECYELLKEIPDTVKTYRIKLYEKKP